VLAIPIFDGVAAVIRRRLTGSAVYAPDRGHIHHCLQRRGWGTRQILAAVAALCGVTGLAALAGLYVPLEPVAVLATLAVVGGCVVTRVFGYFEYRLLLGRPSALWLALRAGLRLKCPMIPLLCWHLRQCRSVDEVWATLVDAAEPLRLRLLELHVASPVHPYDAHWQSAVPDRERPSWHTVLTLTGGRGPLGQITMGGEQHRKSMLANVMNMVAVADTLAVVCQRLQSQDRSVLPLPSGKSGTVRSASQAAGREAARKLSA
jgi:UDP-GlcNAc:undecaprenyl-phosphate GlcNAc-1-phosphate transferase